MANAHLCRPDCSSALWISYFRAEIQWYFPVVTADWLSSLVLCRLSIGLVPLRGRAKSKSIEPAVCLARKACYLSFSPIKTFLPLSLSLFHPHGTLAVQLDALYRVGVYLILRVMNVWDSMLTGQAIGKVQWHDGWPIRAGQEGTSWLTGIHICLLSCSRCDWSLP